MIAIDRFRNRAEAGRLLARELSAYAGRGDVLVLGLPRGGVPVAFEVARALRAPLDVCTVRKLGVPGQEELAMGAVASGGVRVINSSLVRALRILAPSTPRPRPRGASCSGANASTGRAALRSTCGAAP